MAVPRLTRACAQKEGLSPSAGKGLQASEMRSFRIEVFTEAELLVNITKHMLVPKHEVLSDAEKGQLLDRYKLSNSQLPRILQNDPVARYYGLVRGQVVRIIRSSETAGHYTSYRICI